MSIDNVQALPLGTQLGDYRLGCVSHGGFRLTYRAFYGQLAKIVAIKEICDRVSPCAATARCAARRALRRDFRLVP